MKIPPLIGIAGLIVGVAAIGWIVTPYDPFALAAHPQFLAPSFVHPLGTDAFGRDILSRLMVALAPTLLVATCAAAIGMAIGVGWGALIAFLPSRLYNTSLRSVDLVFAFPVVVTAMVLAAARLADTGLPNLPKEFNVIFALAAFNAAVFARQTAILIRSQRVSWHTRLAIIEGTRYPVVVYRHILPYVRHMLMVHGCMQVSINIIAEAGLSFLGFGIQPPTPSLGRMLYEANSYAVIAPWQLLGPGIVVTALASSFYLLSQQLERQHS